MTQSVEVEPGWYDDGVTPGVVRWFDGQGWTEHTTPTAAPATLVPVPPATLVPPAPPRAGQVFEPEGWTPPGGAAADPLQVPQERGPGPELAAAPSAWASQRPGTGQVLAGTERFGTERFGTRPFGATGHGAQPVGVAGYGTPRTYRGAAPGHGPSDVLHWLVPTGRSWQSIVAGYVGLVAVVVWVLAPVAVAFGVWALVRAQSGGHGSGRAVFAIITGLLGTAGCLVVLGGVAFG